MSAPLQQGTRLGRYEIRAQLGTGGMGVVYLAWDLALDRQVAIKILPEDAASNPLSMQRFVQEAKAASALNHPNILTIHEIGTEPGTHFIASEFVDGETLRERMTNDGLTIRRAIDIALQVASALTTAHSAGIVHRDIKPENIMLRRDGIVKVLDFGLAKLTERWRSDRVDADAATMAMVQTQPGVIVGTTAYMSPEQTRALNIDTRTDIWSLGVVLYEMLAGRTPFKGDTPSDTSAAILTSEPLSLVEYVPDIPFELERIVNKALQKDREERYQVVKDLELDLRSLRRALELSGSGEVSGASQSRSHRSLGATRLTADAQATTVREVVPPNPSWIWIASALAVVAIVLGLLWWQQKGPAVGPQLSNLTVAQLVSRKNDLGESTSHARFSPDGKFVAYAWTKDGVSSIWIKQVSGGEPFTNKSTPGIAATPVWSPDGQQIAFLSRRDSENGIWRMPAFGGAATLVKTLDGVSQGLVSWSKAGQIYYISRGNLLSVDLNSNQVKEVVKFESTRTLDRSFGVSPDGERIAYSDIQNGQRDLFVVSESGNQRKQLTNDQAGDSRPVWTPDGQSVIYSSNRNGIKQLFLAYLDGRPAVQLTINDSNSDVLDISPDGTRILYATTGDEADLWSVNVEQGIETKVTADIGLEFWPDISPDGKRIAFQATKATAGVSPFTSVLVVKSIASPGDQIQLSADGFAPQWSPDGKQIAFLRYKEGQSDLWVVPSDGGQPRQLTNGGVSFGGFVYLPYNRVQTHDFQWSADSTKLTYCADVGGISNVWEIGLDGSAAKQLTDNSTKGLRFFDPMFSPKDESVVWVAMTPPQAGNKLTWSIWIARDGKSQMLFESESILDLVSWSQSGSEVLLKTSAGRAIAPSLPVDVQLISIPTQGGAGRQVSQLKDTYFQNIQSANGRDEIAFVTRQTGSDSLHLISAAGGSSKTIVTTNDAQSYLSALVWSPDRKTIYYGKQVSWTVLSMIENFKTK